MNENYLWDKTGADAEIEQLENALRNFRCAETAAPALPSKIVAFEPRRRFSFFRRGFALAMACAVLAIVGAGVWSYVSDKTSTVANNSAKVPAPENSAPVAQTTIDDAPNSTAGTGEIPFAKSLRVVESAPKRKLAKTPNAFAVAVVKNKKSGGDTARTVTVANLSGEEKYAYDQLMLALSITSEKLKIVRDKINLSENSAAASDRK